MRTRELIGLRSGWGEPGTEVWLVRTRGFSCAVREIAAQFIGLLLAHEELRRTVDERTTTGLVTFAPLLIKANFLPVPFWRFSGLLSEFGSCLFLALGCELAIINLAPLFTTKVAVEKSIVRYSTRFFYTLYER